MSRTARFAWAVALFVAGSAVVVQAAYGRWALFAVDLALAVIAIWLLSSE